MDANIQNIHLRTMCHINAQSLNWSRMFMVYPKGREWVKHFKTFSGLHFIKSKFVF